MEDTIAAISTPFGQGAIALVRLSGTGAIAVASRLFFGKTSIDQLPNKKQSLGKIVDPTSNATVDQVVICLHRAPHSYTGEDLVEINCHGGVLVSRKILELCMQNGARLAEAGEFSKRAFTNGKLDLTQAEAVMDIISAKTPLALQAAAEQLEGRLGKKILEIRQHLIELLAHIEAYIDFPEEGIEPDIGQTLQLNMKTISAELDYLLSTAEQGKILREGVRTVICGEPNVGKSSLLNFLLGFGRAIVSPTPGTTRDSIEEAINLRGIPLCLIDTAGLRHSTDPIEQEGIARTQKLIGQADLVLLVVDASQGQSSYFEKIFHSHPANTLPVLNKADLGIHGDWAEHQGIPISCTKQEGMDNFLKAVYVRIASGLANWGEAQVAINTRHQQCLGNAQSALNRAIEAFQQQLSPELIATDLRAALNFTSEVVGKTDAEEILGTIFSRFCIGK